MAVQYRLVRQNDNLNPGKKKKAGCRPQVVRINTINNLSGQCVLSSTLNKGANRINGSALVRGVYISK